MTRTIVTVLLRPIGSHEGTQNNVYYHAVSIDQPIDPNFPDTQPELIIAWTNVNNPLVQWETIRDLAPGNHRLYWRTTATNTSWSPIFLINDRNIGWVFLNGDYAYADFTVPDIITTKNLSIYLPSYGTDTVAYDWCLYPPSIACAADYSKTGLRATPLGVNPALGDTIFIPFVTYHLYHDNIGNFVKGNRNFPWFQAKSATTKGLRLLTSNTPEPIVVYSCPVTDSIQWLPVQKCANIIHCFDFLLSPIANETNVSVDYGVVDEYGNYILQGTYPLPLYGTGNNPPPNYYGDLWITSKPPDIVSYSIPTNPIKPTVFTDITLQLYLGTTGAVPFIYIEEDALRTYQVREYVPSGKLAYFLSVFRLTQTMINQGYYTLVYGRFDPQGHTILGKIRIPLTPAIITEAAIQRITTQRIPSPGRISSIATERISPQVKIQAITAERIPSPAKISQVTTQRIPPSAKIQAIATERIPAPPPPPPPTTFSLGGKVLSLLGPVADAEVTLDSFSTKTGKDGSFYITNIPEGTYTLTVKPTRIHERLLLKSVSQKLDIYMDTSKIINLPLNWTNLGIGAGATAAIGAVLTARKKPKPPTW
jgi:hypothetical protein